MLASHQRRKATSCGGGGGREQPSGARQPVRNLERVTPALDCLREGRRKVQLDVELGLAVGDRPGHLLAQVLHLGAPVELQCVCRPRQRGRDRRPTRLFAGEQQGRSPA